MANEFYLNDCRRFLQLYLRALWNDGFAVNDATDSENETPVSYLDRKSIFLPGKVSLHPNYNRYYLAAATHASAHIAYSGPAFKIGKLNLMQRTIVGLIEDLRVELLSIERFPGLRQLWLDFHDQPAQENSAVNLTQRLSRCVLDPTHSDSNIWVNKGKNILLANDYNLKDAEQSLTTGLALANDLGQMRIPLNAGRYEQPVLYRDNNNFIWAENLETQPVESENCCDIDRSTHLNKLLVEKYNSRTCSMTEHFPEANEGFHIQRDADAAVIFHETPLKPVTPVITYPEWDYKSQILKKDWCKLDITRPEKSSLETTDAIIDHHKFTMTRLRTIARSLKVEKLQRTRKVETGDEIDLDPAIEAMVDSRSGRLPNPTIFVRNDYKQTKNMAISILLDLSESTNKTIHDSTLNIVQVIRDATILLAETLSIADEEFAVYGFSSNSRHHVQIIDYKSFSETYNNRKAYFSDMRGMNSTRLGAAIRHAGRLLLERETNKKLLLVITDGEPYDIDSFDTEYLMHDAHHAVNQLARNRIRTFCLNLDENSDNEIEYIFGKGRYQTIHNLLRLPEVVSHIYAKHTRY